MKPRILVIGNACVGLQLCANRSPSPGETVIADACRFVPDGSAVITAASVVRLGGDGIVCARIGADSYGVRLRAICTQAGIDTRFAEADKTTQSGVNLQLDGGRRYFFKGANANLTVDMIESAVITYPDITVTDLSLDPEQTAAAVASAKSYSLPFMLFLCGQPSCELDPDGYTGAEIFMLDSENAERLTGIDPATPDLCVKVCIKLIYLFRSKYIVLTLGDRGALSYDGKHCEFFPGMDSPKNHPESGEFAFAGALALEYSRTHSIAKACKAANIYSAAARDGADTLFSLPSAEETGVFLSKYDFKL